MICRYIGRSARRLNLTFTNTLLGQSGACKKNILKRERVPGSCMQTEYGTKSKTIRSTDQHIQKFTCTDTTYNTWWPTYALYQSVHRVDGKLVTIL